MSSKDNDEECVMNSKSNNIEIMINDKVDEVIEKLFQPLFSRYQIELEHQLEVVILSLIVLIYYILNVKK